MPEIRIDPITGDRVIIAPERARRSNDFAAAPPREGARSQCPFCPGNERQTPPEALAYRDSGKPNEPGWRVRVFPNKFPALVPNAEISESHEPGIGRHEVLIENPDHDMPLSQAPPVCVSEVLQACRERFRVFTADQRLKTAIALKNNGPVAGATRDHPHMQLLAMPFVPPRLQVELEGAGRYFAKHHRCVYCDIVERELTLRDRLIEETEFFTVVAPVASRFAYEMWILPVRHQSNFELLADHELRDLGQVLGSALWRLKEAASDPPYNFILHSAPFAQRSINRYHWHIEIMPKLTNPAGFEWGTGVHVNPVPPEEAAEKLRSAQPSRGHQRSSPDIRCD